jgi:hypothetical protein
VSEKVKKTKLVEVKKALARKYDNLAKVSKSKPKKQTFLLHAERYRRQANDLLRK